MTLWWSSWSEFWAMGGHAFFVWMSFGALLVAIVVEMVSPAAAAQARARRHRGGKRS